MSTINNELLSRNPHAKANERFIHRKNAYRLIPLLFICYLFAHLDRINIGFAKIQMSTDLGFSNTVYGLGAGLFFISYMLFGVPSNIMLEKVGPRKWIATLMIVWGLMSTGMLFVRTPYEFYVLRFLLGVAEAGFFPGIVLFINRWFARTRRAEVMALFAVAVPMAGVIGAPVSGWILEFFNEHEVMAGWQWMFLLEGLPVVFLGLLVLGVLPSNFSEARWLTPQEQLQLAALTEHPSSEGAQGKFSAVLRSGRVWILVITYSSVMLAMGVVAFWMPTLIAGTGIKDSHNIGLLTAIPYLLGCICMVLTGRSSDRLRERRWHVLIPLLAAGSGISIAASAPELLTTVLIGMCLATAGATTALPMFWQLPASIIGSRDLAIGIAFISSLGSISSFLSPSLVGWMRDTTGSASLALYTLSGLIIVAGLAVLCLPKALVNPQR